MLPLLSCLLSPVCYYIAAYIQPIPSKPPTLYFQSLNPIHSLCMYYPVFYWWKFIF